MTVGAVWTGSYLLVLADLFHRQPQYALNGLPGQQQIAFWPRAVPLAAPGPFFILDKNKFDSPFPWGVACDRQLGRTT